MTKEKIPDSAALRKAAWQNTVQQALQKHREITITEFAQATTFHGIKHIFDSTTSPTYRFLWAICWIAAVGLFTYQVTVRVLDYSKHPTNIDIKIIYNKTVDFPAVTICNQNQFRFRAAADLNIYYLLDAIYNTSYPESVNMTQYHIPDEPIDAVFSQLAHNQLDFIANCRWDYKECDRESSFEMQATDMGYCFTFNLANSSLNTVKSAGIRAGLRLVLNVEQYEYMRGPQNDAGAKVFLHDQKEFPMVTDMGFSVAPGTHTVAAVKLTETKNLGAPYGTCVVGAEPMTNCRLACLTHEASKDCGCRDFYMNDNSTVGLCDMQKKLVCLNKLANEAKTGDTCSCPEPCQRRSFDVSLSSAQLSRFNVERAVIRDNTHRSKVQQDFYAALEKAERYIVRKWQQNENVMGSAYNHYTDMMEQLLYGVTIMANSTELANSIEALDMTSTGLTLIMEATATIIAQRASLMAVIEQDLRIDFSDTHDAIENIEEMYEYMTKPPFNSVEGFRDKILECMSIPTRPNPQVSYTFDGPDYDSECQLIGDSMLEIQEKCEKTNAMGADLNMYYKNLFVKFNHTVTSIYEDSEKTPLAAQDVCLEQLASLNVHWQTTIDLMSTFVLGFQNENATINDKRQLFVDLANGLIGAEESVKFWKTMNLDACAWLDDLRRSSEALRDLGDVDKIDDKLTTLVSSFSEIIQAYSDTYNLVNTSVSHTMNLLDGFLSASLTKLDLIDPFLAVDFQERLTSLYTEANTLEKLVQSMKNDMDNAETEMVERLSCLRNVELPILDDKEIQNLTLITYIQAESWSDTELNSYLTMIAEPGQADEAFKKICVYVMHKFYDVVKEKATACATAITRTTNAVNTLLKHFEDYTEEAAMDQNFYLQNFLMLDIYYSELTYETVTQQKAFEFLSLLSEIGGFLGLLLGASVLTMCEVLDYGISHVLGCCSRRNHAVDDVVKYPS